MVDVAAALQCNEAQLRFQILNGSLYIDHIVKRSPQGWYPVEQGKGVRAALYRWILMTHMILEI